MATAIKKPTLNTKAALDFAEGKKTAARTKSRTTQKAQAVSKSGQVPAGDVRLTANIRGDLHLRLKIEAAQRRTTIGDLIEELIEAHI